MKLEAVCKEILSYKKEQEKLARKLKERLLAVGKYLPLAQVLKELYPRYTYLVAFRKLSSLLRLYKNSFKIVYLKEVPKHHYYVGLAKWKKPSSVKDVEGSPKLDLVREFLKEHPEEVFTIGELVEKTRLSLRAADLHKIPRVKVGRINYYGSEEAIKKFKSSLRRGGIL